MVFHIHLVSDSTGETLASLTRACLVQFENVDVKKHYWNLIRSSQLLKMVFKSLEEKPGLVLFTFVDEKLKQELENFCHEYEIECIPVLKPVLRGMISLLGKEPIHSPGRQHVLDEHYFDRIDAMDFAMAQDDGHGEEELGKADVIIIGVSRTSKTPTCVYLAGRGIRAANIPFILGNPLPDFSKLKKPLIVGLVKDVKSLVEIRRNRLKILKEVSETPYTNPESVREEVQESRRFFVQIGCPIIDVSRRSIEETSAEIMMLLTRHKEKLRREKKEKQKNDAP
ncbi:MAG: kinase/pyrophosphorylase [Alphaproteobacteria bacterium]|nr:kinase/pyrophosphorylase [Alphaproteobacteria bacterium]